MMMWSMRNKRKVLRRLHFSLKTTTHQVSTIQYIPGPRIANKVRVQTQASKILKSVIVVRSNGKDAVRSTDFRAGLRIIELPYFN
jgi:hypothetical protein